MRLPLPESLRQFTSTTVEPQPTRDASTIVLLRDGANGIETYLLRRRSTLEFAPGVLVFPGGGVHDADRVMDRWSGPEPAEWAEKFGCDEATARGLVVAAVRETFEEAGILFASTDGGEPVFGAMAGLVNERRSLDRGELDFSDFLRERDLVIRTDLIGAWAHWVTPTFETRRYDTRFFVAAIPAGQETGDLPGEADRASWWALRDVWPKVDAGEVVMLPPTAVTCRELADLTAADLPAAVAARTFQRIQPELVVDGDELFLEYPMEMP